MLHAATQKSNLVEKAVIPAIQIFTGSILLALAAQVTIPLPFTPVPLSLQTFFVFLLALTLGSKKGTLAILTYLAQGTLGFPVFAGGLANSAWLMGPRAGYLIGFVIAGWVVGKLAEKNPERSFLSTISILCLGEAAILIPGALWLSAFVGLPNMMALGVTPFLAGDMLKIIGAALSLAPLNKLLKRLF